MARPLCRVIWIVLAITLIATPVMSAFAYGEPGRSSFTAEQQVLGWDDIQQIPDQPLESSPLRLRRIVYELLLPVSVADPSNRKKDNLPLEMVNQLNEDSQDYLFDEGRITNSALLEHDWALVQQLVKLLKSNSVDDASKQVFLDGLYTLLRADHHIALLAIEDGKAVLVGAEAAQALDQNQVNQARAHLNISEIHFQNGLDALRKGDADRASHHFLKAWEFAYKVQSIWGISYGGDWDQDGVPDVVELRIGSSPLSADTDSDGLSDQYEIKSLIPTTLPNAADTDNDGIPDGDEDPDEDGLTIVSERDLGTDPLVNDTDRDTLSDGDEVNTYGTAPLLADTDTDGLRDDSEFRLQTDPRNPDTDGDGIQDGDDTIVQTLTDPGLGVTVELTGIGDHSQALHIRSLDETSLLNSTAGLVGHFVDISTELPVASATIRLKYDPALVPDGDFENLHLFRYDSETSEFQLLPNQQLDNVNSLISADTTQFSPFGILYVPKYEEPIQERAVRAGFDTNVFGANDDGTYPCASSGGCTPTKIPMGFSVNFFGKDYDSLYLNNNGNVTFDSPLYTYTPFDLTATQRVIVAPFFADVDTRAGNLARFGTGTVGGHAAFGATWPGVGCYSYNVQVLNYFQLILVERPDIAPGDFDIEFNYNSIQWETGEASGGNSACQGGASARVGYSNGSGDLGTFYELPGSGIPGLFLDSDKESGLIHRALNTSQIGRYVFPVRAGAPVPGLDSDHDGLTDAEEIAGFRTQFRAQDLVFTDPFNLDTDADGIPDGDEIVSTLYGRVVLQFSDPTNEDTDGDWLDDFVEKTEWDTRLLDKHSDGDYVFDGYEVQAMGTDPLVSDTDGDGRIDGEELYNGSDPLLKEAPPMDEIKAIHEWTEGAVYGEFGINDPDNGNLPYFTGMLMSGLVSVIPGAQLLGLITDLRDFIASLAHADWGSVALNAVALVPYLGEYADIAGTTAKFIAKFPEHAGEINKLLKVTGDFWKNLGNASPELLKAIEDMLRKQWGDDVIDALLDMGFSVPKMAQFAEHGVDMSNVMKALNNSNFFTELPELADYFKTIDVAKDVLLKGNGLTANLQKLGNYQKLLDEAIAAGNDTAKALYKGKVDRILSNIRGAYTQFHVLPKLDNANKVAKVIHAIEHANMGGIDRVLRMRDGALRLQEAKSGIHAGEIGQYSTYVKAIKTGDMVTGVAFNSSYFLVQAGKRGYPVESLDALRKGIVEVEIVINDLQHADKVKALYKAMGADPEQGIEYVEAAYKFTVEDTDEVIEGIVRVFVTGVSQ